MLGSSLLLAATAALSFLPGLVNAAPAVTIERHENGSVTYGMDYTDDDGNVLGKRMVYFEFEGCDGQQTDDIYNAWKSMLEMAELIKDKVNFNERVAIDYLGPPSRNKDHQEIFKGQTRAPSKCRLGCLLLLDLIKSVATWRLGSGLDWRLLMTCNDPIRMSGGEALCPHGTSREDYYKCNSRCWDSESYGKVVYWKPRAVAYTKNRDEDRGDYINWCPEWFNRRPCDERASKFSTYYDETQRYNMVNYECREQAMVHELFHIDKNREANVPDLTSRIKDRSFKLRGSKSAYGPLYTKVLARYSRGNVGFYVATNADNLAFYFLGKWIQERYGIYPHKPVTNEEPEQMKKRAKRDDPATDEPYDTPDIWDPIRVVDGQVTMGDLNDLAVALGAETREEAKTLYDYDPDACLDLVGDGEGEAVCDADAPVELEATEDLEAGPVEDLPAGPAEDLPAGPVPEGPDAEVVTPGDDEAQPTEVNFPEGSDPNAPDAEVVVTQEPEAIPTEELVDALTAGLGEPLPVNPDAEEVDLPENPQPEGSDAAVIPNEGAEVIPNKGAQSSVPSNSTRQG
ncbi:hypothetical protein FALCPG4_015217 [Fusarium falciforme]